MYCHPLKKCFSLCLLYLIIQNIWFKRFLLIMIFFPHFVDFRKIILCPLQLKDFQFFVIFFEIFFKKSCDSCKYLCIRIQNKYTCTYNNTGVLSVLQTFPLFRDKLQEVKSEKESELDFLEKQTLVLTTEMKDKIRAMVEEVERKVRKLHFYCGFINIR